MSNPLGEAVDHRALGRLSQVYLKDRLSGASEYLRIAGYFRSSIFDLVNEEIELIGKVRVVCNSDLDPLDIGAAKQAREQMLKERWNDVDDSVESFLRRPRYRRLYEILKRGNVEVRAVSRADAPFLHGKAGAIRRSDGSATAFMGSLNETREGWSQNYELVWEDSSPDGVAWVEEEFEHLWNIGKPLPDAIVDEIGRSARRIEVRVVAVDGRRSLIALIVQEQLEVLANFPIVLNDQDRSSARRRLRRFVVRRTCTTVRRRRDAARRQWDLDREYRPLSVRRAHPDRMAEQFAQAFDDREAQAQALASLAGGVVHLMVFVEDRPQLRLGDADPGVPDLDAQFALASSAPDEHPAALGEFQGVRQQVADHLLEQTRIASNGQGAGHDA